MKLLCICLFVLFKSHKQRWLKKKKKKKKTADETLKRKMQNARERRASKCSHYYNYFA